jgi:hypothetical protein
MMETAMKPSKLTFTLVALLLGSVVTGSALAHGGHGGGRVFLGFNFGFPGYYYPAPYYYPAYYPAPMYYPAPVVVQSPPVYTERQDVAPSTDLQGYWYYCSAARGYYPYVKECPGGWQKVPPQPSN